MKQAGLISGPPSQGKEDDGYEGKGALLRRIRPDTGGQQAGAKNVDQAEQGLKMQGDMVIYQHAHDYRGCPAGNHRPCLNRRAHPGQLRRTKQLYQSAVASVEAMADDTPVIIR